MFEDILGRLRAVERRRAQDLDENILETFDNGFPLGPTLRLDFGDRLTAVPIGENYVRVNGAALADIGWDAIVDNTFPESDPELRLFKGIGEALMYLRGTAGITERAFVLVRRDPTSSSPAGKYIETANVTNIPDYVYLFATNPIPSYFTPSGSSQIRWDHGGFNIGDAATNWYITGLHITGKESAPVTAGKVDLFKGNAYLIDCFLEPGSGMNAPSNIASVGSTLLRSTMPNGWLRFDSAFACSFRIFTAGTYAPSQSTVFRMLDCNFDNVTSGNASVTWTMPQYSFIRVLVEPQTGNAGLNFTAACSQGGINYIEQIGRRDVSNGFCNVTSSASTQVRLKGYFPGVVTLASPGISVPFGHEADIFVQQAVDITGPCKLDLEHNGALNHTLRGESVTGRIITNNDSAGSGTFLSFVNADFHSILISAESTGGGTRKPYNFDASSAQNVLVFAGKDTFPVAGTDAGTNNRVLPEGTTPFGVNGHVIEDEGTPLTQRANLNFVGAGVTVTDATPDTVVTITGAPTFGSPVESQFGDDGADGAGTDAARDDHVHDRHDDGILFYMQVSP